MRERYDTLNEVLSERAFYTLDLALRRGRHVGTDEVEDFAFLRETQHLLQEFYDGYGWQLVCLDEALFFLLPSNDSLGQAQISERAMLVGQVCLLMSLDGDSTRDVGWVSRAQVLEQLGVVLGEEELGRRLAGETRTETSRIKQVNSRLGGALRELHRLGFVQLKGERLRLRNTLVRFADPVRGEGDWRRRLVELVARGFVALEPPVSVEQEAESARTEGEE